MGKLITLLLCGMMSFTTFAQTTGNGYHGKNSVPARESFEVNLNYDVNVDGNVDPEDMNYLMDVLFGIILDPNPNADINGDGLIDVNDVNSLYNYLRTIPMDVEQYQGRGDVDGNGVIDDYDLDSIWQNVRKNKKTDDNPAKDINEDGVVDAWDYFILYNLIQNGWTQPAADPDPDPAMYLAGSMTSWAEGKEAMTLGEDGKWTITKDMEVNAEFKFINENDEWIGGDADGYFIVSKEQVENGTELTLVLNGGNNFQIPVAGSWTLTVDPENMKLVISGEWNEPVEETHLYILGNVGDQRWDPSVGTEMQATEENVFEYTGTFNDNSYFSFTKKLAEDNTAWDDIRAYRVGATSNNFEVDNLLGEAIALGEWNSSADNAFLIVNNGEYTITVDLNNMTVVFTKKGVEPELPKGDVDGDNKVDVSDVNAAINIILELKDVSNYPGKADLNGDEKIDISDVNEIINIILAS